MEKRRDSHDIGLTLEKAWFKVERFVSPVLIFGLVYTVSDKIDQQAAEKINSENGGNGKPRYGEFNMSLQNAFYGDDEKTPEPEETDEHGRPPKHEKTREHKPTHEPPTSEPPTPEPPTPEPPTPEPPPTETQVPPTEVHATDTSMPPTEECTPTFEPTEKPTRQPPTSTPEPPTEVPTKEPTSTTETTATPVPTDTPDIATSTVDGPTSTATSEITIVASETPTTIFTQTELPTATASATEEERRQSETDTPEPEYGKPPVSGGDNKPAAVTMPDNSVRDSLLAGLGAVGLWLGIRTARERKNAKTKHD